jgi:hypothetical protein
MKFSKRTLILAGLINLMILVPGLNAVVTVNITEEGSDVVVAWSGSWNMDTALDKSNDFSNQTQNDLVNAVGNTAIRAISGDVDDYDVTITSEPSSSLKIGSAFNREFGTVSGDGMLWQMTPAATSQIWVPDGYVSGTSFSGTLTIPSQTFASLDLNTGSFVWTWDWAESGNSDSLTLNVGAVPEPSTYAAFLGLAGLALATIHRKRAV